MRTDIFTPRERKRYLLKKHLKGHLFEYVLELVFAVLLALLIVYLSHGTNYWAGVLPAAVYSVGRSLYEIRSYQ